MLLKIAGATTLAAAAGLASMSYVVVDVREGGPGGHRILVPLPILAAQAALSFVPASKTRIDVGEDARRYLPLAREMAQALRDAGDAELVRVQDGGDDVRIATLGDMLQIDVTEASGEEVHVRVSLDSIDEMLASCEGGRVDVQRVLSALKHAGAFHVDVKDGGDHVRVAVY